MLYVLFPFFFINQTVRVTSKSFVSLLTIFILSILGYVVAFSIPDPEFGNRILHGFGGGFMGLLVCFLVIKDTKLQLGKFQFVIFSLLVVAALGVANEILEFFLQNYLGRIFAQSVNDTWYDLTSNLIGSLIAALLFVPFIDKEHAS